MTDRIFSTTASGSFSTNSPSIYQVREFSATAEGIFSTNDFEMDLENRLTTSINGKFSTNSDANLRIIGTSNIPIAPKKIQYFIDDLITDNIQFKYPKYRELILSFLKFLDLTSVKSTLNILNNVNINYVYDEFVNAFLNQYFNSVIDTSKYGLTNDNKKRFLQLSRILNNLKGNQKVFDFLFRTFTNIRVAQEDQSLEIDKIIVEFIENESWWNPTIANFYDGSINYDGSQYYFTDFQRPFTYQFKIDQSRETMLPLIQSVHPAGFNYEFLTELTYEDDLVASDDAESTVRYFHYYAYGVAGYTDYLYDGSITYSEYHDDTLSF